MFIQTRYHNGGTNEQEVSDENITDHLLDALANEDVSKVSFPIASDSRLALYNDGTFVIFGGTFLNIKSDNL